NFNLSVCVFVCLSFSLSHSQFQSVCLCVCLFCLSLFPPVAAVPDTHTCLLLTHTHMSVSELDRLSRRCSAQLWCVQVVNPFLDVWMSGCLALSQSVCLSVCLSVC